MGKRVVRFPGSETVASEASAQVLGAMADGAPVPLWMADASGQSTYHNQAWLDFTGRTRDEMGGRAWIDSVHPDDLERCLDSYRQAFRERRKFEMEYRMRRHDGEYRWVLDTGAPFHRDDGTFCGFIGANFDITEIKRTKEELDRTNSILTTQIETSPDGILVVDPERKISYFNRRFGEIWKIPPEIIASRLDETMLKTGALQVKDPHAFYDRVIYLYDHPEVEGAEDIEFKDGRVFDRHCSTLRDGAGKYLGRVWTFHEITERRRSEEILRGRNLVLERLAAGAPLRDVLTMLAQTAEAVLPGTLSSILFLDRDTRRLRHGAAPSLPEFYNDAIDGVEIGPEVGSCGASAYTGKRVIVENIMTHPFWAPYRSLAERAGVKACWSEPILSSKGDVLGTFAMYYREPRAPGAWDLDFIASNAHLAGIAIEHKRSQEESAAARDQAEIANRAKTEFLANMSHELRSPLNSVLGLAEIMKDEFFGPMGSERYRGYADDIYQSAKHLLDVITDILDISKIEAGRVTLYENEVDMAATIDTCARLMYPRSSEAKVVIEQDVPADLPFVFGDARKIKQILLNLLSNAVKFTPKDGTVTISARVDESGEFCLTVSDTGIGIAPGNVEKALTAFTQVDSSWSRKYEGTGLGLPITKALTELHGGTLAIKSTLGSGTTVTVMFPAHRVIPRKNVKLPAGDS